MPHESKGGRAGSLKLGAEELLGFAGFATLVFALYGLFGLMERADAAEDALRVQIVCGLALLAGFALAHGTAYRVSQGGCRPLLAVASVGVAALAVLYLVPGLPMGAVLGCAALAALGAGALECLWFGFLCLQQPKMVCFYVSTGVCAGMAGALLAGYLYEVVAGVLHLAALAASAGSFVGLRALHADAILPAPVESAESDKRYAINWQSMVMLGFTYFEVGFLAYLSLTLDLAPFACGGAAAAALVFSVDAVRTRAISERSMLAPMVPVTVGAFLLMFGFGPVAQRVAAACLAAIATVFLVLGWTALVGHVRIFRLSALRVIAKARVADCTALCLGLACGHLTASLAAASPLGGLRCCVALAIVYAIISSFLRKPRFPEPGIAEGERAMPSTEGGPWRRRCRALSEQYDLSERQYEVLVLIAQGRNAKYIQEALTISLSTAQTHIRNIYRKVGVHSRQELLSLIESTKLYGEEE